MPIEPSNPDLAALAKLKESIRELTVEWPDGGTGTFDHIDIGYMSKPVAYPYVSLHTTGSRGKVTSLGVGAGKRARTFEVDVVVAVEYEHSDAEVGFARLTQLRWDLFFHLIAHKDLGTGVEFTNLEDATVHTYNVDDGEFQDWGFFGQILIPMTIILRGANL
jgi:hypothetical protein